MKANYFIIASLALTTGLVGYVVGHEQASPNCGTTWSEVKVEDEFCSTWWENDHVVIGPLHERP